MCYSFNEKWINQLAFCVHIQLCLLCGAIDLSTSMGVFFSFSPLSISFFHEAVPSSVVLTLLFSSFYSGIWYIWYLPPLKSFCSIGRKFILATESANINLDLFGIGHYRYIVIICRHFCNFNGNKNNFNSMLAAIVIGHFGFADGIRTKCFTFSYNIMLCTLALTVCFHFIAIDKWRRCSYISSPDWKF